MITVEDVRIKLQELGATADEVANALRKLGIKGFRGDQQACPINAYLGTKFAGATWKSDYLRIEANVPGVGCDVSMEILPSDAVTDFMCAFDFGRYAFLQR